MSSIYCILTIIFLLLVILYLVLKLIKVNCKILSTSILIIIVILIIFGVTTSYGYLYRKKISNISNAYIRDTYINLYENISVLNIEPNVNKSLASKSNDIFYFPSTYNNQLEIISDTQDFFAMLFNEINNAKHHIHIQEFIINDDNISNRLQTLLISKSKQGVKVRIIMDGLASNLSNKSLNNLRNADIEVCVSNSFIKSTITGNLNNRDHRKIFIIDGKVAFTGGVNIGDEYLGLDSKKGYWRDIELKLEGYSVNQLQSIFLANWYIAANKKIYDKIYYNNNKFNNNCLVEIINSDPGSQSSSIEQLFIKLFSIAKKNIYITSPYIVLDDKMYGVILSSIARGIDVKIIIPSKPDEKIAFMPTLYYANKLSHAGAKIYTYTKGHMHSKTIVVDDNISYIGTANLNNRSIHLDYENCVVAYNTSIAQALTDIFFEDLNNSKKLDINTKYNTGFKGKLFESFSIIMSPLM